MYKKMDAETRALQLARIAFQLDVLEGLVEGPFVAGEAGWCVGGVGGGGGAMLLGVGVRRSEMQCAAVRCSAMLQL